MMMEYCCDQPENVLGRTKEGLWYFGLDEPWSIDSSVRCYVSTLMKRIFRALMMMEAWLVKFWTAQKK